MKPGTEEHSGKSGTAEVPTPRGKAVAARRKKRASPKRRERQFIAALPTFVAELAACGNVSAAARIACIDRPWIYKHAARDKEFAEVFAEAQHLGNLALEDEARRRGHHGWREPVIHQGRPQYDIDPDTGEKVPITVRKHSDTLLIFLLKGAFPDKYKDRAQIEGTGGGGIGSSGLDLSRLSVEELEALRTLLSKARQPDVIDVDPTTGDPIPAKST